MRNAVLSVLLLGLAAAPAPFAAPAFASDIKAVVNNVPVTSYDIQSRSAFLKLQGQKGDLQSVATEQMIDQALRQGEMKRLNIRITDDAVNDAYARFAKNNKLSVKQLDEIMAQSGVTKPHFKEFIRTQMGWNQALSMRYRSESGGGRMTEQEAVRQMLKQGGAKPSSTEYMLQQVIFVVPASERQAKLGRRKQEAQALRARFSGCESTREFAKGLIDVTVRDLGRTLAPELPTEWAEDIKTAKIGGATPVRETDRGVEFIGICNAREVSDDRVATMVLQQQSAGGDMDAAAAELDKKFMTELHERAKIVRR
ncbi:MAG TPA: SurA N-terminal domain-containing protein [Mesorhizobium sp.]|jgi:peptidyl-prolyl cis-trans isomerase SurA|nr:SurA N-terminal domain-containing protein [Mesorhizobium sp.]